MVVNSTRSAPACLGALLIVFLAVPAGAVTYTVDQNGGGDFATIQEAVDAASSGDRIEISADEYHENVICAGKALTLVGQGAGQTTLTGVTDAPALKFQDMSSPPGYSTIRSMTINCTPSAEWCVYWNEHAMSFYDCQLGGKVGRGNYYGAVGLFGCDASDVSVKGGMRASFFENSTVGNSRFAGSGDYGHQIDVVSSTCGNIHLAGTGCELEDVECGIVTSLSGYSDCVATHATIESIDLPGGNLELTDCSVAGDVSLCGWQMNPSTSPYGQFKLVRCLVEGAVTVDLGLLGDWQCGGAYVTHTTIGGDFSVQFETSETSSIYPHHIRGNLVLGSTSIGDDWAGWPPVITHNDFVAGATIDAVSDSIAANIETDPLLCSGELTLQECSPCVAAAHDGGDMGVFTVGCECLTVVESASWGRIKAMCR